MQPKPEDLSQAHEAASGGDCTRSGKRVAAASMVPNDVAVGAVRISANGWEAAVLEGLEVCPVGPARLRCSCRRQRAQLARQTRLSVQPDQFLLTG